MFSFKNGKTFFFNILSLIHFLSVIFLLYFFSKFIICFDFLDLMIDDFGATYDTAGADATGGTYTKIGRQVTVHGHIHLTSKGSSTGSAKIHGLPFTSNGDDNNRGSGSVGYVNQMNLNGPILILEEVARLGFI